MAIVLFEYHSCLVIATQHTSFVGKISYVVCSLKFSSIQGQIIFFYFLVPREDS
jgi:hypothetical protein